jgi:hypothetical protein
MKRDPALAGAFAPVKAGECTPGESDQSGGRAGAFWKACRIAV